MEVLVVLLGLVLLDWAAMRWGASSVENVDSPEWARRGAWRGFGG